MGEAPDCGVGATTIFVVRADLELCALDGNDRRWWWWQLKVWMLWLTRILPQPHPRIPNFELS